MMNWRGFWVGEMNISTLLQELVKETIKLCDEWIREGKLRKEIRLYQKYKVKEFEYKEDGFHVSGSFPVIPKEEWNILDVFKLIKYTKNLPSFKDCIAYIAEEYPLQSPNPKAQAESWVSRFLQKTILEYLNGNLNPKKDLVEYIVTFIHDLEGNPIEWEIKVWLEGIGMKVDEIKIEKGIIIRKPKTSDIEYEYPLDMPLPLVELEQAPPRRLPSAILEIRRRINLQPAIYPDLERIIIALQLYKVGSVSKTRIYWKPKSFLQFGGISTPMRLWSTTYRYSLDVSDAEKLPQFVAKIKDKLPIEEKTGSLMTTTPLGIAILRYQDAILKPEAIENKIAYAVMGLEALYLKAEEKEELSRRLAQRVAKLLSFFEEEPIKVYRIVKKAYNIRSGFVHGSPLQNKKPQEVKEILDNIIEYLRKSILTFIQLQNEKKELLSLIDEALLEKQKDIKLQNLIKNLGEVP